MSQSKYPPGEMWDDEKLNQAAFDFLFRLRLHAGGEEAVTVDNLVDLGNTYFERCPHKLIKEMQEAFDTRLRDS